MVGEENSSSAVPPVSSCKTYWRSASWSSSRTSDPHNQLEDNKCIPAGPSNSRRCPAPPLTPRSLSAKVRPLPPLQPLSIAPRNLDEWPRAGSDDLGEWPNNPPTPGAINGGAPRGGDGLKLDLSSIPRPSHGGKKEQIAFFDKECSKVADHIYLGGDWVARNREVLRQNGITHILNCVGFVCPEYFKSDFVYRTLWLQDSPSEDITSILYDVFDYFEDVREQGGRVFVHCCQGVSRSTSLVIAYLMWRKGQSFDDAFENVKAARGIANPNMGFACQLLQCQKRVHAIPLSPNSVLRMYRMAPHSPYNPLHLVPKMLNEPLAGALDSRGAFIVHFLSSIYVWIGRNCNLTMANDAKTAAIQVVRYEKVQGPFVVMLEGEEKGEFWEAFSSPKPINPDAVGKRKVDAYNSDFEVFYKAVSGGVVPPFSSSDSTVQNETRLPTRECDWSALRRKFVPDSLLWAYSDSALTAYSCKNRLPVAISPPFLSPSSLSSDSSVSSKYSSDSPTDSPSTSSPPSLIPSPVSGPVPDPLMVVPSSRSPLQKSSSCKEGSYSPLKSISSSSIAERRSGFSPLKLAATLGKESNKGILVNCSQSEMNANGSVNNNVETVIYRWPGMEEVVEHSRDDLDLKSVYIILVSDSRNEQVVERKIYLCIGREFECTRKETDSAGVFDWYKIARNFLDSKALSSDFPIKVHNIISPAYLFTLGHSNFYTNTFLNVSFSMPVTGCEGCRDAKSS
jgi:Dual specificity phosphatase, catalytic domain